uniref:SANTA domain-containing protein n=1 Tax=Caenorhabditis tropicalis TaxID=1561998 RepID=A0A1I7UXK3_9PELO
MEDNHILPARVQNVLDMEIVRLNLWSIKFNSSSIKLEGYVRSEDGCSMQKICSEIICKRMNATMLFDVSGRFFELAGQIDREFQSKMGMPSRIIDEFVNGFPENWGFLINSCLTMNQMSVPRPIQAAPREPLRSRNEPIVTLADETELNDGGRKNSESEKDKKQKEREQQRMKENERKLQAEKDKKDKEAVAAAEKKRQEEEDAANYTLREFQTGSGDPITPIRFKRGTQSKGANNIKPTFLQTPVRGKPNAPLASSTPQAPPPEHPRRSLDLGKPPIQLASPSPKVQKPETVRETQYASDSDLFAVPRLPAAKNNRPPPSSSSETVLDFFDDMDVFFDTAVIEKTPVVARRQRRLSPEARRDRSSSRDPERFGDYDSTRYTQRYNNDYDMSRMSRRDAVFRRNDERRDDSRMSRKRGYYSSPENDFDRRRPEYYESDSRYDTKRPRPRENSSSSGRSVRFHEDHMGRGDEFRGSRYERGYREFDDQRGRGSSADEDKRKLNAILIREKELMARLQNKHKPSASRRVSYSSDEDSDDMAAEWERDNQEIMDNSMLFGDGIMQQKRRSARGHPAKKKQPIRTEQHKPAQKRAPPKKKSPAPRDDLNDSIASNRPRRACATPSTPAPKRITWRKRDLDKLQHVISLKKPTAADVDWVEVTRLLAKEGVEPEVVKQAAITKLKWKEPVRNDENMREEEDESRRRRGVVARVKEGVRMHEELMNGGNEVEEDLQVQSVEDYQPEDVAADQSLLALGTPLLAKKKGGTRGSIIPKPVEDSPIARGKNSSFNSPRLDQTKAKEMETTLKYVQQISMMQARPSFRANKSQMNNSTARGSKNTSMSVEQGTRKALKIINRGRAIQEESEEDEEDDDDDEFEEQEEGDNSIY